MKHDYILNNYKFTIDSRFCKIHRTFIKESVRQIELFDDSTQNIKMIYLDVLLIKRDFFKTEGERIEYKEEVEPYLPF